MTNQRLCILCVCKYTYIFLEEAAECESSSCIELRILYIHSEVRFVFSDHIVTQPSPVKDFSSSSSYFIHVLAAHVVSLSETSPLYSASMSSHAEHPLSDSGRATCTSYLSERLPPSRLYHSLIHLSACLIYVCLHARAKETSWKGTGKTVHTYVFSFLVLFLGSAVEMPKGSKFKQGSFHKVGRLFASTLHP